VYTELLLSCPGLRNSSPFTTAVASVFTTHPFRIFTVPFDKYEEPTCLQTYSTFQIKNDKIKRVSDFIVELCYNVTRALFSAGDLELSGVKI